MVSLLNGLSSLGAGVASFAGSAGLEQQKADLLRQQTVLADQLAGARQDKQNTFQSGENDADRKNRIDTGTISAKAQTDSAGMSSAATRYSADQQLTASQGRDRTQIADTILRVNELTSQAKNAQFLSNAPLDQRLAFAQAEAARLGIPVWSANYPTGATGQTISPIPSDISVQPGGGLPGDAKTGGPPVKEGYNIKAFDNVPPAEVAVIKGMVSGTVQVPSGVASSKPEWNARLMKAMEYDPNFDQTTWAARVATRKDFTSGPSSQALVAANTSLGHAGLLLDSFSKLNNFGGIGTLLNSPLNAAAQALGDERQTNAQTVISALASEARKVFAGSGGGNLTELEAWEKNFPINGSPSQQKGSLKQFAVLLESRISALADKYNSGMGQTSDPLAFLNPPARAVFQDITGQKPDTQTGHQYGTPASERQPAPQGPTIPTSPIDPTDRKIGSTYRLPNGALGTWNIGGWKVVQ